MTSSDFQSLSIRREAACFSFICKILSGECVEPLLKMCPDFKLEQISTNCNSSGFMGPNSTRSSRSEVQVTSMVGKLRNGTTLNTFGRCFIAQAHDIFNKNLEDIKQRLRDNERIDGSFER